MGTRQVRAALRSAGSASALGNCKLGTASAVFGTHRPERGLTGFVAESSVEARYLVVDDPPAVGVLTDDHAEAHGEGAAVAEAEVDGEVAEHQSIAQRAGLGQADPHPERRQGTSLPAAGSSAVETADC
jgi:hypothetical protein